jgi:calcium-dependent protein kinase
VREASLIGHNLSVAIKSISKSKVKGKLSLLKRELHIMRSLDHPSIIKYYEAYEDQRYIHIVMELCNGGDLLDRVLTTGSINEREVCEIMRKLVRAVVYLHEINVAHRDLKPDNFLFSSNLPDSEIKIVDFGESIKTNLLVTLSSFVGTASYIAPEVITGGYSTQCDTWSLGVVMYLLLSGEQPFEGSSSQEIIKKIVVGKYAFSNDSWRHISDSAKDLISQMLTLSQYHRISLKEALKHPWFSDEFISPKLPLSVLRSIKRFKAPGKLQKEVMRIMLKYMSTDDIEDLKRNFLQIDSEKTGFVSVADLQMAMTTAGLEMPLRAVTSIFYTDLVQSLDSESPGKIKYSDFLMVALDKKKLTDAELVFLTFHHFDKDSDGYITAGDLKRSLAAVGDISSLEEIERMMSEWDMDNNRLIDYEEFGRLIGALRNPACTGCSVRIATARTLSTVTAPLDSEDSCLQSPKQLNASSSD